MIRGTADGLIRGYRIGTVEEYSARAAERKERKERIGRRIMAVAQVILVIANLAIWGTAICRRIREENERRQARAETEVSYQVNQYIEWDYPEKK